jgi:AraC-like DNA-binding protein
MQARDLFVSEDNYASVAASRIERDLGYGSPSAFIYAFRRDMGTSPQAYCRRQSA